MTPRPQVSSALLLRRQPLFSGLDAATIARLAAAATRHAIGRGELLFRQGAQPTGMYVIVFGRIKMVANRGTAAERLTGIAGPGQSVGEPVMVLDRPALVDAIAVEDSLVLHLPKQAVYEELERNPRFVRALLTLLSKRVESLVLELQGQSVSSGRARLVRYLLGLASAAEGEQVVRLPVAKAQVASQLGLTAEHFSRLLHELAREGWIRVQGRDIAIASAENLAASQPAGKAAQAGSMPPRRVTPRRSPSAG